jgi:hypothetical protein
MPVGESVSNGTLWDTSQAPRGNIALPSIGALLGGPPLLVGPKMENMDINLEHKESSAVGDSDKGFCSEAPQIGAAGQNPVEQGAGVTPLIGNTCSLAV